MVKDRSGTRWMKYQEVRVWFATCIRRRGTRVSWFSLKTNVDGFFGFGLKSAATVC
jgi:hypothetical protein